jgi:hypothetical protein
MDHIRCPVLVEYERNLEEAAVWATSPDAPLIVAPPLRERRAGIPDYEFRFVGFHAVKGDVFQVPVVPTELHARLSI